MPSPSFQVCRFFAEEGKPCQILKRGIPSEEEARALVRPYRSEYAPDGFCFSFVGYREVDVSEGEKRRRLERTLAQVRAQHRSGLL